MNYTHPGFIYILLAVLLCSIYYGLEMSNGGINFMGKSILSSWSITSLLVMSIIFGVKSAQEQGLTQNKHIIIMYILSIGTLSASSLCIYSAQ
jgi:hypothetical protein